MTQLNPDLQVTDYMSILADPTQSAQLPQDDCLGWTLEQKATYLKNMADVLTKKDIHVHLTDRYYPEGDDLVRKEWELETDVEGKKFRPVPIGELDTTNNIYLNIKEVGFLASFFTIMHLYGHRVQIETMENHPDTAEGKQYDSITKYVSWEKPLVMEDVYQDYRQNCGRPNADYTQDFLAFECEAFSFGYGLMEEANIPIDKEVQYAVNTYIITDFEEIKTWWQNSPMKDPGDFNERYNNLYNEFSDNKTYYDPIETKQGPYSNFGSSANGVVVVRAEALTL